MRPSGRARAGGSALLLAVSTLFPLAASVWPREPPPRWLGLLDVLVAFATVFAGMVLAARARALDADVAHAAVRGYQMGASVFLVLLVVFFLAGDAVRWHVLLPGLAWRAWLLAYALPSGLALWRSAS